MATDKQKLQMSEDFDSLVRRIQNTSDVLQQDARLVINRNVTTRAWLTGFYIVEYEQHGKDRAKYGDKLLKRLAEQLDDKSFSLASLKNYRQFYLYYPEIARPIADYLQHKTQKSQSLISLFQQIGNQRLRVEFYSKARGSGPLPSPSACRQPSGAGRQDSVCGQYRDSRQAPVPRR